MKLANRLSALAIALPLFVGCASGDSGPTGPGGGEVVVVWALNSIGQTIRTFEIGEGISPLGLAVELGGLFDGVSMDVAFPLAVTSESSFGGDRAIVADLESGGKTPVAFLEPQGDPVNPSKPFVLPGMSEAIVGGRGTNSIYRFSLDPPGTPAVVLARDAGEFVEKVVVANGRVFAIDSNIDDVGGTFEPLGNSRVAVFDLEGAAVDSFPLPGFQATDAVLSGGKLVVLNAGTLTPTFEPEGNGTLAVVDPVTLQVSGPFPLGGNGVSLEEGADGQVYVTVTNDFAGPIRTLSFDVDANGFVRGPDDPIRTRDDAGADISCWVATSLADGRLLCATFRTEQAGTIYLLNADGSFISSTAGGFGTSDLEIAVAAGTQ
ncbi:MAG: hypothetical protein V3S91_04765 [Gemmatimonadota bacterium]|jgi:hypothetical protein